MGSLPKYYWYFVQEVLSGRIPCGNLVSSSTEDKTIRNGTKRSADSNGNGVLTAEPPQLSLVTPPDQEKKRKVKNGKPSNELVLSAYTEGNDTVFPHILRLYVKPGSKVADITYGKGVFWRKIPEGEYELKATDLQDGVDCRSLPYEDGTLDCVVFDPPYMHTPGGSAHTIHNQFEDHYRNNATGNLTASKYHEAVLELYNDGGKEAYRVLRERGVFIVKCQDEVCANQQRFTHVEIMAAYQEMGFVAEDLFVVVRNNRPGVSRVVKQVHARKNHSYFLVFWKPGEEKKNKRWTPPQ